MSMTAKKHANIESYGCKSHEWTTFYHSFIGDLFRVRYILIVRVLIVSILSICQKCILVNISSKNADMRNLSNSIINYKIYKNILKNLEEDITIVAFFVSKLYIHNDDPGAQMLRGYQEMIITLCQS